MNTLLHREGDHDLNQVSGRKDREITLGTTLILAIFLALAVLCAVFFGFGYSVGRKSVPAASSTSAEGQSTGVFAGFKPAAGSAIGNQLQTPASSVSAAASSAQPAPSPAPIPRNAPSASGSDPDDGASEASAPAASPLPHGAPPAASSPSAAAPAVVAGGTSLVQIAAVSHQEDADLLVTTLKRRGYNVIVRSDPGDKLLHVQVGPFASHKDADVMRQRLLGDGFNAIVKDAR